MNKKILMTAALAFALASCGNATEAEPTSENTEMETKQDILEPMENEDQAIADSENHIAEIDQNNLEANKEENNQEEEEESKETKVAATDEENVEEPIVDNDLISNDGSYYTAYDPSSHGEISQYGTPFIESWKIEGDILTVKGSMQYPYPDGEYLENKIHTFKLTDQTTYTGVGGDGEFEKSKEDILDTPSPSNTITVKDGVVTNIRFSS